MSCKDRYFSASVQKGSVQLQPTHRKLLWAEEGATMGWVALLLRLLLKLYV